MPGSEEATQKKDGKQEAPASLSGNDQESQPANEEPEQSEPQAVRAPTEKGQE